MFKPTDDELHDALEEAERMREKDTDPHHIAKSLQYLNRRNHHLEKVYEEARKYIYFGQEEREHTRLLKVLESAKQELADDSDEETETLGL